MSCRTCFNIPCTKPECDINNEEGCNDYKNYVKAEIEKIDRVEEKE